MIEFYFIGLATARSHWREVLFSKTIKKQFGKLVEKREPDQSIIDGFITKKDVLKDLYITVREEVVERDPKSYWEIVEDFNRWYDQQSQETLDEIFKKTIVEQSNVERFTLKAFFGDEFKYPGDEIEKTVVIIGDKKKKKRGGDRGERGKPKPLYKYRFPDGHVELLTSIKAYKAYTSKGVNLVKVIDE